MSALEQHAFEDDRFVVVLGATGDRATAESDAAILLAAATLVDDEIRFGRHSGRGAVKALRASLYVTELGVFDGTLTTFARNGRRVP